MTDLIRDRGRISVEELVNQFSTSAETVRRDLTRLAAIGKIRKIHGGAVAPRNFVEGPFAERMQQNVEAKRSIARKAMELITPGQTLFIDTGSTTLAMAEELANVDQLTVITNSAEIAKLVSSANASTQTYLLGGRYNLDNRQTCGEMALTQLSCFHADLALLTPAAISAEAGAMDFSFDEAAIARAMIERSERVALMADSSKFEQKAPYVVAPLEKMDFLISEVAPQGEMRAALAAIGTDLLC